MGPLSKRAHQGTQSSSRPVAPAVTPPDLHRTAARWFGQQPCKSAQHNVDVKQIRLDIINVAEHTRDAVVGILECVGDVNGN